VHAEKSEGQAPQSGVRKRVDAGRLIMRKCPKKVEHCRRRVASEEVRLALIRLEAVREV
jgi:hypothetical protein